MSNVLYGYNDMRINVGIVNIVLLNKINQRVNDLMGLTFHSAQSSLLMFLNKMLIMNLLGL